MEHGRFITVIHAFGNLLTELPPPLGDVTDCKVCAIAGLATYKE